MWYEKLAPENVVALWHRFLERVSWVLFCKYHPGTYAANLDGRCWTALQVAEMNIN